jgi:replication factor A1
MLVAYRAPDLLNARCRMQVVPQDGRFYSESDGQFCDKASHRYILSLKAVDSSGDVYLSLFNDQAEAVLGCSADAMAEYKATEDEAGYVAQCKAAQWSEWALTVATKSREYQGERKLRHTVVNVRPVNASVDGARLLDVIRAY